MMMSTLAAQPDTATASVTGWVSHSPTSTLATLSSMTGRRSGLRRIHSVDSVDSVATLLKAHDCFAHVASATLTLAEAEQELMAQHPPASMLLAYLASDNTAQVSLACMAVLRLGYRSLVESWLTVPAAGVPRWVQQFLMHQFSLSA